MDIKIGNQVGYYQITGKGEEKNSIRFLFVTKPNVIHRFFCRVLLGWYWYDLPNWDNLRSKNLDNKLKKW